MEQISLNEIQKQNIRKFIPAFKAYLASDEYVKDKVKRAKHLEYFQCELPTVLPELSEVDIVDMVQMLWAYQMWSNKQYVAQKIVTDNGIEKVKQSLIFLLDKSKPAPERYSKFLNDIKGVGPASVTEILCFVQPAECGIWNRKARVALKPLGLDKILNPKKYQLSAKEYATFNATLQLVAKELEGQGIDEVDLLLVDFFLYEVGVQAVEPAPEVEEEQYQDFDHNEIRDLIESIGVMLGFDVDKELQIAHGARVDGVWRAKIGNLGMVTYVFEVHKSGSMDSLLLNLQKAKSNPTVQKVIAVSDKRQLEIIKREIEGLPEEFKRSLGFWEVGEVQKVGDNLQESIAIINRLGLVQGEF
jgi:hypothetical protein